MSQLFTWGGQSTGVSALASVFPKKSQGWSRTNQWIEQICKIKNQYTKMSGISIQKQQAIWRRLFFLSPFAIASKKIKYLGINLTKEWKSYTLKTIKNWLSKSKMTQINRKIFHVHVLEEY